VANVIAVSRSPDCFINWRRAPAEGRLAFVLYDLELDGGKPFRNTEFLIGDGHKIKSVAAYFGSKIGRAEDIK
jgi:hypothetical protein